METPGTPSVLPTRQRMSPRFRNFLSNATLDKERRRNIHLIFAIILGLCSIAAIIYFFVFIFVPNKDFLYQEKNQCVIVSANLACWRKKLLSNSAIEQGKFSCWQFVVNHSNGTGTAVVQHNDIDKFPTERDGCFSESSCGKEVWPCRIDKKSLKVSLRWSFPVSETIYCTVAFVAFAFLGSLSMWKYQNICNSIANPAFNDYLQGGVPRNASINTSDIDNDSVRPFDGLSSNESIHSGSSAQSHGSTVPFTFRRRMPTWMQQRSPDTEPRANQPSRSGVRSPS